MSTLMITCFVKYQVDLKKLEEFREYSRTWIALVEKYGGTHHGYFLPPASKDNFPKSELSMSWLAREGAEDVAVALFSFPDTAAYEAYRRQVVDDPLCKEITEKFMATPSFLSYERNFLEPIF